jgi:hypothetical protein
MGCSGVRATTDAGGGGADRNVYSIPSIPKST